MRSTAVSAPASQSHAQLSHTTAYADTSPTQEAVSRPTFARERASDMPASTQPKALELCVENASVLQLGGFEALGHPYLDCPNCCRP